MSKKINYSCCAVPLCRNTSIKTPAKLFINVPKNSKKRKLWLRLANRVSNEIGANSVIHFCEDHFNLPEDMENYSRYKIMGSVKKIIMKGDCIPTKFECQGRQSKAYIYNSDFIKRQHPEIINDALTNGSSVKASSNDVKNFPVDNAIYIQERYTQDDFLNEDIEKNLSTAAEDVPDIKQETHSDEESENATANNIELIEIKPIVIGDMKSEQQSAQNADVQYQCAGKINGTSVHQCKFCSKTFTTSSQSTYLIGR